MRDSRISVSLLVCVILLIGYALQDGDGSFTRNALFALSTALGLLGLAVHISKRTRILSIHRLTLLLSIALGLQCLLMMFKHPVPFMKAENYVLFFQCMVGVSLSLFLFLAPWKWSHKGVFYGLLTLYVVMGSFLLHGYPDPTIDVFVLHQESLQALSQGINPHSITITNKWPQYSYYPKELIVDGQLMFGFPYPTMHLFFSWPSYALTGDYRYALLIALALSGWMMYLIRPDKIGMLIGLLYVYTPKGFWIAEHGWNEAFIVLIFAGVIYTARHRPNWTPYILGLFLASKQYLFVIAPLVFLLLPQPLSLRKTVSFAVKVALTGLLVTVPFILWDVHAYSHSVLSTKTVIPIIRKDALSISAWLLALGQSPLPTWFPYLALLGTMAWTLWRIPRTPTGFAMGVGLAYMTLFLFNYHAFCNHFHLILGTLCCGIVGAQLTEEALEGTMEKEQNLQPASEVASPASEEDSSASAALSEPS